MEKLILPQWQPHSYVPVSAVDIFFFYNFSYRDTKKSRLVVKITGGGVQLRSPLSVLYSQMSGVLCTNTQRDSLVTTRIEKGI